MKNKKIINNNDLKKSVIEAEYNECNKSVYLIDNPCSEEEDSIGFGVYVNNLINILTNTPAKMIGLISNYGSGKSTVINMVENRSEMNKKGIFFAKVNLWNLPSNKEVSDEDDLTINIHKSFLNQILRKTNLSDIKKKSLEKQINKNYGFLDLCIEDTNFTKLLSFLFALLIFIIITKVDLFSMNVPRIALLILEFAFASALAQILIKSKIYFSFNKESKNTRTIDEFETTDCFFKIMEACKQSGIKKVIICIEDIDRFTNGEGTIRFLEQIYKFYSESVDILNIDIKFIVAIKPASKLETIDSKQNDQIKNLYEKIFDYIINLQPVAIQNYDVLIQELLFGKYKKLQQMNILLPTDPEASFYHYLYKGKKNTIRDIKHRYNYAISLYENLLKNKQDAENVEINIETCFFVAYLEDEFTDSFYNLITDSESFEKMVINRLTKGKLLLCEKCPEFCEVNKECPYFKEEKFIDEIEFGFANKLIDMNYSMYFYKLPKSKKIKNVFDTAVSNIILTDNVKECETAAEYIEKANVGEIIQSLSFVVNNNSVPNVIFKNEKLFDITYDNFKYQLEKYVLSIKLKEQENKVVNILDQLVKFNTEKTLYILEKLLNNIVDNLKQFYENQEVLQFRKRIIHILNKYQKLCGKIFIPELPKISYGEMFIVSDLNIILEYINPNQVDDELVTNLLKFSSKNLKNDVFCTFLEKCISIEDEHFNKLFYGYKYNFNTAEKYKIINNVKIISKLKFQVESDYLNFFNHLKFLPVSLEKDFLTLLIANHNKTDIENDYVKLIKNTNQLSRNAMKYFDQNATNFYCFNYDLEEMLYSKKYYKLYVYSKTNRTGVFCLDEEERIETLKETYIDYFKNSTVLLRSVRIDKEMAKYIYKNIDLSKLSVERRCLLNVLDQTHEDIESILHSKDEVYVNSYLKKIKSFATQDQEKILNEIYLWATSTHQLNKDTYELLRKRFSKQYRTKLGCLKRLKYLK